jgi:hypothetical protein
MGGVSSIVHSLLFVLLFTRAWVYIFCSLGSFQFEELSKFHLAPIGARLEQREIVALGIKRRQPQMASTKEQKWNSIQPSLTLMAAYLKAEDKVSANLDHE